MRALIGDPREPMSEAELAALERDLGVALPPGYRAFLQTTDGGVPSPAWFPIFGLLKNPFNEVQVLFGARHGLQADQLGWNRAVFSGRLPAGFLPIGGTDSGDLLCLCTSGGPTGAVFFWNHEAESHPPDTTSLHFVARDFESFLEGLLPDPYEA